MPPTRIVTSAARFAPLIDADQVLALQRTAGNRAITRLLLRSETGVQQDSDLMWRQLRETLDSPQELWSYTVFGWSKNDWRNAGNALLGYAQGVGEVIMAPGVLTYYATGSILYNSDPQKFSHYREQAQKFAEIAMSLKQVFSSPASAAKAFAQGFTSQLDRANAALAAGDAKGAGAGIGNFTLSVLTMAESSSGREVRALRSDPRSPPPGRRCCSW